MFRILFLFMATLLAVSLLSCGFIEDDAEEEEAPAAMQSVTPSGGELAEDGSIILNFDTDPGDVSTSEGSVSGVGRTRTISGPFSRGALNLRLNWSNGAGSLTLIYQVKAAKAKPPPEGMVLIPGGAFQMGSEAADAGNDEQPVHTVHVDAFYMDKHEVTNLEYKRFVLANPQWQKTRIPWVLHNGNYLNDWSGNNYPSGKANHPVVYVSWYGAMAYSAWAGKRLPTEAEWEKAARGGKSGLKYPWGNTISSGHANYVSNVGGTTAVGRYAANGYGLYDMTGNVWEWCLDAYDSDFYFSSPSRNPLSDVNTISNLDEIVKNFMHIKSSRVLRGGSWYVFTRPLRVANRLWNSPASTYNDFGFRCARAVTPQIFTPCLKNTRHSRCKTRAASKCRSRLGITIGCVLVKFHLVYIVHKIFFTKFTV